MQGKNWHSKCLENTGYGKTGAHPEQGQKNAQMNKEHRGKDWGAKGLWELPAKILELHGTKTLGPRLEST